MRLNDQQKVWLKQASALMYKELQEGANDESDWDSNPGAREKRQEEFQAYHDFEGSLGNMPWHTPGHANREVLVLTKETYRLLKEVVEEGIALTKEYLQQVDTFESKEGPVQPDQEAIGDLATLKRILKELE